MAVTACFLAKQSESATLQTDEPTVAPRLAMRLMTPASGSSIVAPTEWPAPVGHFYGLRA